MASDVSVLWTCDHCAKAVQPSYGRQPSTWHHMHAANPPRNDDPQVNIDLCEACWDSFCQWWQSSDTRTA